MTMNNTRTIGNIGERIALNFLLKNGYKILERNFRVKFGEIDIIALIDHTIVFIEVKSRSNNKYGFPYESVNYKKQQKIIRVAQNYIKIKNIKECQYRFDIIEVYLNSSEKINHIVNAFWT
ncbi:MAG: YraN family protein [Tissierellales bacterium]